MHRLQWSTLLLLAGLIAAALWFRYEEDFTRIISRPVMPEAPRYFTDPDVLAYLLSYRTYRRPLGAIDYLIFAPLQARLTLQEELKKINIRRLLESDVPGKTLPLDIYGITQKTPDTPLRLSEEEELKSGFDIGREGAVYKLVIPGTKRIIPVMELGVEPDQTEDLEKMNLTPKAKFEVIVPLK